jgi:hypothetical protein
MRINQSVNSCNRQNEHSGAYDIVQLEEAQFWRSAHQRNIYRSIKSKISSKNYLFGNTNESVCEFKNTWDGRKVVRAQGFEPWTY